MSSVYPGALDTLATNKANATAQTTDHPAHHNDLADAVNKVEAELGVNPSGAAATVAARLNALAFNVKDYGATGDGTTDDTAAIQSAITAAVAVKGTVYFPPTAYPNAYKVTSSLVITPASGATATVNLIMDGDTTGILWGGSDSDSIFQTLGWVRSYIRNVNVIIGGTGDGVVAWDIDTNLGANRQSSHLLFERCAASLDGNTCVGWRLGHSEGQDMSSIVFIECSAIAPSAANGNIGWVWEYANVLSCTWVGCNAGQLAKAWTAVPTAGAVGSAGGAGMNWYGTTASANGIDFEFQIAGPYAIHGGRFETGDRFLSTPSNGASRFNISVNVTGAMISAYTPPDNILFKLYNAGSLTLDDVTIPNTTGEHTAAMISVSTGPTGYGSVNVRGGAFRAADPFYTVVDGNWEVNVQGVGKLDSNDDVGAHFLNRPGDGLPGMNCWSNPAYSPNVVTLTADRAYLTRFVPRRTMAITLMAFSVQGVASANDNVDLAIYSVSGSDLVRVASSGATAGLLNSLGTKTIAVVAKLIPGKTYYAALSCGTLGGTAATLRGVQVQNVPSLFGTAVGIGEEFIKATSHPLPATISTPSADQVAVHPSMAVRES